MVWKWPWVTTRNFLSLAHTCLVSQALAVHVWCPCRQPQHRPGPLRNAESAPAQACLGWGPEN